MSINVDKEKKLKQKKINYRLEKICKDHKNCEEFKYNYKVGGLDVAFGACAGCEDKDWIILEGGI